jgi:urease accessory protein
MAIITMAAIITMDDRGLFDILSWMSPAWPIGAFAHSGGLEWAVEVRQVSGRESTTAWISDLLDHGAFWNDAVIFVHAHRAAAVLDQSLMQSVAELSVAALTSRERHLESTAQGAAFRRIAASTADTGAYVMLLEGIPDEELTYPVAAASLFAIHHIPLQQGLTAFLHGTVANVVSAAQRLIPIGQTDGQHVLRALREAVFAAVAKAMALPEGDPFEAMGSACLSADLACMAHETQYTRLFRT